MAPLRACACYLGNTGGIWFKMGCGVGGPWHDFHPFWNLSGGRPPVAVDFNIGWVGGFQYWVGRFILEGILDVDCMSPVVAAQH